MISRMSILAARLYHPESHGSKAGLDKMESERLNISLCYSFVARAVHGFWFCCPVALFSCVCKGGRVEVGESLAENRGAFTNSPKHHLYECPRSPEPWAFGVRLVPVLRNDLSH